MSSTTTARYRFEFRILKWAEEQSRRLCGSRHAMFIGLRPDCSVRRVYFAPAGEGWSTENKRALTEAHPAWLLYLPYEEPASGYLEWAEVPREVFERWLERSFEVVDFQDVRTTSARDQWPRTWQVIVG